MSRLITAANKSRKEPGSMQTLYFNSEQTKELLRIAGDAGVLQMLHYVAIAHQPNPNMEDSVLATMLDKSEQAIKATRLKLTKAEWFKRITHTSKGQKSIIYLVGKEAVSSNNFHVHLST